jgi:hypothetical protein
MAVKTGLSPREKGLGGLMICKVGRLLTGPV